MATSKIRALPQRVPVKAQTPAQRVCVNLVFIVGDTPVMGQPLQFEIPPHDVGEPFTLDAVLDAPNLVAQLQPFVGKPKPRIWVPGMSVEAG